MGLDLFGDPLLSAFPFQRSFSRRDLTYTGYRELGRMIDWEVHADNARYSI